MTRKTEYPYDVARNDGFALFRSQIKPTSIYQALYSYGRAHSEKWQFERVTDSEPAEVTDTSGHLYRLTYTPVQKDS